MHASQNGITQDLTTQYCLACLSHHRTAEARHTAARTSLRLLAVLNVLFKYACARQAARAFFLRPACA